MKKLVAFLSVLLTLVMATRGCTPQQSSTKGPDDQKFIEVYVALVEQSALPDSARPDSSSSLERSRIFARLGTTEEAFRKSIDSYGSDPQRWKVVLEEVVKRLEEKMKEPGQTSPR